MKVVKINLNKKVTSAMIAVPASAKARSDQID